MTPKRELTFPPFRLDVADERLWRGGEAVPLAPKALAVLRHLAENRGRLVTKTELLDTVWAGVEVGEAVLKSCIREIRAALRDPARAPLFIETVHRRGYRFIAGPAPDEPAPTLLAPDRGSPRRLPVVGRGQELEQLRGRLARAREGEGQIVAVVGPPGIGKTTLIDAFVREAVADDVRVAWGQCVEHGGAAEAYLPVLQAIGRLCRGPAGDRLVPVLRKYAPSWLAQLPSLIDADDREALQREIFGATPERMLREMLEAVEPLTSDASLVLVLEDLHWSDWATLDLLGALARRRDEARLLVIGTFRDVETAGHPLRGLMHELLMHRLCEEIRLPLLDLTGVEAYLAGRFGPGRLPGGLGRLIHERTDGNPLFVADVVDDLVRQGAIAADGERWRLDRALEEIGPAVPESLRHMIAGQFDQLTPEERALLEAASVSGAEFSLAEIAPALSADPDDVEAWSERLVRRHQFIRMASAEDSAGSATPRYAFIHSLYRHAIEARLTGPRRARLHQRIGEEKESGHGAQGPAVAPELAAHFEQARDHRRAIHHLIQAADNAVRRYANRAAIDYLTRALDAADRAPAERRDAQRMPLLEQRGRVRRLMGDMRGAAQDFAAWADVARHAGSVRDEVRALLYQSGALSWTDRERSLSAAGQAVALSRRSGDPLLHARAIGHQAFGRLLGRGWRDEDARACFDAMGSAQRAGDRFALNLHVARCAYLLCHRSEYRAATDMAHEGLELSLEFHDPYHYMACQFHRGWALLHLGQLGEALDVFADGGDVADRNGHLPWARVFRFGAAWVRAHAFDFEGARDLCEQELGQAQEPLLGHFLGRIVLAAAEAGLGRHERALATLEAVASEVESGRGLMDWILRMPLLLTLASCRLERGELAAARDAASQLAALAALPPERSYLAMARRALASIAMAEDDRGQADAELSEALAALDGAEAPLAEWRVHETAAALRSRQGRSADAGAHRLRSAAALRLVIDSLAERPALADSLRAAPRVRALIG